MTTQPVINFPRSIGMILLIIWLLLWGLLAVTNFQFEFQEVVMGFLAIGAAIFLAIGR